MPPQITIKEPKEIVVVDYIFYETPEELFADLTPQKPLIPTVLHWAEGVVFHFSAFPWNELLAKEYIENDRVYWATLRFAPMETYVNRATLGENVFFIKRTKVPVLVDVAKQLKKEISRKLHNVNDEVYH